MSCPCLSNQKKIVASIKAVILFLIFASPMTFKLVQSIFGKFIANQYGLPTGPGLIVHAILFGLVTYALMGGVKNPFPKTTKAAKEATSEVTGTIHSYKL
jgi:hypothetical protein